MDDNYKDDFIKASEEYLTADKISLPITDPLVLGIESFVPHVIKEMQGGEGD